jgi:hypothetical protein
LYGFIEFLKKIGRTPRLYATGLSDNPITGADEEITFGGCEPTILGRNVGVKRTGAGVRGYNTLDRMVRKPLFSIDGVWFLTILHQVTSS